MEYAIIAAGKGSRLATEGLDCPKPLAVVGGQHLIDRLIGQYQAVGATHVYVVINNETPMLEQHLNTQTYSVGIRVIKQNTPSSLHSFYALLQHYPMIERCCLATTDTVFMQHEFDQYIRAFDTDASVDALMAVTTYIDDEKPLYVRVDRQGQVNDFLDEPYGGGGYVSGGVYCLRKRALQEVEKLVAKGESRMRNYQRALINAGLEVKAFPFSKIIDVDHLADIAKANAFVTGTK